MQFAAGQGELGVEVGTDHTHHWASGEGLNWGVRERGREGGREGGRVGVWEGVRERGRVGGSA